MKRLFPYHLQEAVRRPETRTAFALATATLAPGPPGYDVLSPPPGSARPERTIIPRISHWQSTHHQFSINASGGFEVPFRSPGDCDTR